MRSMRSGADTPQKFPAGGNKLSKMGSEEMNQAVAHSLALLYERTDEQIISIVLDAIRKANTNILRRANDEPLC